MREQRRNAGGNARGSQDDGCYCEEGNRKEQQEHSLPWRGYGRQGDDKAGICRETGIGELDPNPIAGSNSELSKMRDEWGSRGTGVCVLCGFGAVCLTDWQPDFKLQVLIK